MDQDPNNGLSAMSIIGRRDSGQGFRGHGKYRIRKDEGGSVRVEEILQGILVPEMRELGMCKLMMRDICRKLQCCRKTQYTWVTTTTINEGMKVEYAGTARTCFEPRWSTDYP